MALIINNSLKSRFLDPHHFNANPDPSFHSNAYPDLVYQIDAEPDPKLQPCLKVNFMLLHCSHHLSCRQRGEKAAGGLEVEKCLTMSDIN